MMTRNLILFISCFLILSACNNNAPDSGQTPDQQPDTSAAPIPDSAPDPEPMGEPSEIDGKYVLTGYEEGGAAIKLLGETEITADFDRGKISGIGSCNPYHTRFSIPAQGQIAVSDLASAKKFCNGVMTQENRYFTLLKNAQSYSRPNETQLQIQAPEGKLTFRKQ